MRRKESAEKGDQKTIQGEIIQHEKVIGLLVQLENLPYDEGLKKDKEFPTPETNKAFIKEDGMFKTYCSWKDPVAAVHWLEALKTPGSLARVFRRKRK